MQLQLGADGAGQQGDGRVLDDEGVHARLGHAAQDALHQGQLGLEDERVECHVGAGPGAVHEHHRLGQALEREVVGTGSGVEALVQPEIDGIRTGGANRVTGFVLGSTTTGERNEPARRGLATQLTYGFSRDDCDAYAVESQKRTAAAWNEGRFARSIVPVSDINGLPMREHIGRRPTEVLPEPLGSAVEARLQQVFETGDVITGFGGQAVDRGSLSKDLPPSKTLRAMIAITAAPMP